MRLSSPIVKIYILLITFLLFPFLANAHPLNQTANFWSNINFKGTLNQPKNWLYQIEIQSRFLFEDPVYERNVLRFGFGRVIKPSLSLWFGYDIMTFLDSTDRLRVEERWWPQILWRITDKTPVMLDSRTRLELRDEWHNSGIAYRFRQKLTANFKFNAAQKIIPVIYDEIFFNLNHPSWISDLTLDQNRILFGLSIPLNQRITIIPGYLNRYIWGSSSDALQHVAYLELSIGED